MHTLLEGIVADLQSRKGEWRQIAHAAEVPYDTLTKIAQGRTPNPRVRTLERLLYALGGDGRCRTAHRHPLRRSTDQVLSPHEVRAEIDPEAAANGEGT